MIHPCYWQRPSLCIRLCPPVPCPSNPKHSVKPYRTHPSSNIQSSVTQKCCGVELMIYFVNKFFIKNKIFSLRKCWFKPKEFMKIQNISRFYLQNFRPHNLKWVAEIAVAEWTFAVRFHAQREQSFNITVMCLIAETWH